MIGVTSNSESESDQCEDNDFHSEDENVSTKILNSNDSNERVSVTLWTKNGAKKAEMNVFEISSAIINRVDSIPETYDYLYIGIVFATLLSLTPVYFRICDASKDDNSTIFENFPKVIEESFTFSSFANVAFGGNFLTRTLLIIATFQRLILAFFFFFLLAVAERTFKQRYFFFHFTNLS